MAVSVAELEYGLTSSGEVGEWLWTTFADLPLPEDTDVDPVWPLGDSAPLAYTALPHGAAAYEIDAVHPSRSRCTGFDARLLYGDFVSPSAVAERGS